MSLCPLQVCNKTTDFKGCKDSNLVGDGYCHDEANKIQCAFDGGDCCYSCVNKEFCKQCLCINENGDEDITLGSEINVGSGINVGVGRFLKKQ